MYGAFRYVVEVHAEPSSLISRVANIFTRHILGWPKQQKEFILDNPMDENEDSIVKDDVCHTQPLVIEKNINVNWLYCIPRGTVDVSVRLEQDRIRPGQALQCLLMLDMRKCRVEIEGVQLYILTKVNLIPEKTLSHKTIKFQLTSPDPIKGSPISEDLEHEERRMELTVPSELPKSFQSKMILVEHFLVVEFCLSYSRNQKVLVPITIDKAAMPSNDKIDSKIGDQRDELADGELFYHPQIDSAVSYPAPSYHRFENNEEDKDDMMESD